MKKVRRKSPQFDAVQWLQHGDHPAVKSIPVGKQAEEELDRGFLDGRCIHCGMIIRFHGTLDARLSGETVSLLVCPGDWILTDSEGRHLRADQASMADLFEPVG